jgi:hypothetical protein
LIASVSQIIPQILCMKFGGPNTIHCVVPIIFGYAERTKVGRKLTVRRPREMVPMNLVMLIGHTILCGCRGLLWVSVAVKSIP